MNKQGLIEEVTSLEARIYELKAMIASAQSWSPSEGDRYHYPRLDIVCTEERYSESCKADVKFARCGLARRTEEEAKVINDYFLAEAEATIRVPSKGDWWVTAVGDTKLDIDPSDTQYQAFATREKAEDFSRIMGEFFKVMRSRI